MANQQISDALGTLNTKIRAAEDRLQKMHVAAEVLSRFVSEDNLSQEFVNALIKVAVEVMK